MNSVQSPFSYRLFGLTIQSEVELAELSPQQAGQAADILIRLADLPGDLARTPGYHRVEGGGLLVIEEVGRYLARDGCELLIEPAPGVPDRNLRLYLLGSAFGMLLHQRGLLPLHANAVVVDGLAYAFTGPSGSGKSTLAAWFLDHDFPLLSDDVCVIGFDAEGAPIAWPGLPRLRLWRDAIERSGRDVGDFQRSYEEDSDQWEKYDVPASGDARPSGPCELGGVFLVDRAEPGRVEQLTPADALATLFANIYRGEYLVGAQHEAAWRACLRVAGKLPVSRWFRPWDAARIDEQVTSLLSDVRRRSGR